MIPTIPELDGYVLGPNGEQLRTPLQQIEKNKDDIEVTNDKINQIDEQVNQLSIELDDKVTIPGPDTLPEDATFKCVIIDGQHQTSAKEYSNQPVGNSIAQRTGGGGLLLETQYSSPRHAATLQALETAQAMAFADSFSANTPSYPYKPYQFAAKTWKSWTGTGTITNLPFEGNWYQKLCNASDSVVRVVFQNGALTSSPTSYTTIGKITSLYTDKASLVNASVVQTVGRHDLILDIQPHSVVQVYVRNRPSSTTIPGGYTQIWVM